MFAWSLLSGIFGIALGYFFFYFRYENRELINELRRNLKQANTELDTLRQDYAEYEQQNMIFKRKVTELLKKNTDLSQIVSELSRYYYNIKLGSEKMEELTNLIAPPDKSIVEQIKHYAPADVVNNIEKEEIKHQISKKDFF